MLLAWVLGIDRAGLLAHPEAPLGSGQRERFERAVERRETGEPVAYIRGLKEFHGAVVSVDPRVLIPRPETEALVELAIERITTDLTAAPRARDAAPYRVWDVGTGSGAIAIATATELRRRRYGDAVRFHLSDSSADAMAVALVNAVSHGLADVFTFGEGDLLEAAAGPGGPVELVVANLPYVPSATLPDLPVAASFEPVAALDGGPDGLDVIRRLLGELPRTLASGGAALLEIGGDQADLARDAVDAVLPGWAVSIHPDLSGSPRVVLVEADE